MEVGLLEGGHKTIQITHSQNWQSMHTQGWLPGNFRADLKVRRFISTATARVGSRLLWPVGQGRLLLKKELIQLCGFLCFRICVLVANSLLKGVRYISDTSFFFNFIKNIIVNIEDNHFFLIIARHCFLYVVILIWFPFLCFKFFFSTNEMKLDSSSNMKLEGFRQNWIPCPSGNQTHQGMESQIPILLGDKGCVCFFR